MQSCEVIAAANSSNVGCCAQGSGHLIEVQLMQRPHGALVIPASFCSGLALLPGGAACVIIQQMQQQLGKAVAVLCTVCPSFPSKVTSHF
jgi:hypothetical protein